MGHMDGSESCHLTRRGGEPVRPVARTGPGAAQRRYGTSENTPTTRSGQQPAKEPNTTPNQHPTNKPLILSIPQQPPNLEHQHRTPRYPTEPPISQRPDATPKRYSLTRIDSKNATTPFLPPDATAPLSRQQAPHPATQRRAEGRRDGGTEGRRDSQAERQPGGGPRRPTQGATLLTRHQCGITTTPPPCSGHVHGRGV